MQINPVNNKPFYFVTIWSIICKSWYSFTWMFSPVLKEKWSGIVLSLWPCQNQFKGVNFIGVGVFCSNGDSYNSTCCSINNFWEVGRDKQNLISVSVADWGIPTSANNAGNEVHRVSSIIRWPEGWDLSGCMRDWWLIFFLTYDIRKF